MGLLLLAVMADVSPELGIETPAWVSSIALVWERECCESGRSDGPSSFLYSCNQVRDTGSLEVFHTRTLGVSSMFGSACMLCDT